MGTIGGNSHDVGTLKPVWAEIHKKPLSVNLTDALAKGFEAGPFPFQAVPLLA